MKALYNHLSEDTAYLVDDYPYGRKLRCRIRYWIEKTNKGFRSVYQTENPKNLMWNAPKKSTYHLVAMNMYLDENEHVHFKAINEYSSAEETLQFIKDFPDTDKSVLLVWCGKKASVNKLFAEGKAWMEVNGVRQKLSEEDIAKHQKEADTWRECFSLVRANVN